MPISFLAALAADGQGARAAQCSASDAVGGDGLDDLVLNTLPLILTTAQCAVSDSDSPPFAAVDPARVILGAFNFGTTTADQALEQPKLPAPGATTAGTATATTAAMTWPPLPARDGRRPTRKERRRANRSKRTVAAEERSESWLSRLVASVLRVAVVAVLAVVGIVRFALSSILKPVRSCWASLRAPRRSGPSAWKHRLLPIIIVGVLGCTLVSANLQTAVNECLDEAADGSCACRAPGCGGYTGPINTWDVLHCALFVVATAGLLAAAQNFVYPMPSSIERLVPLSAIGYRVLTQPQRRLAAWLRSLCSSERCSGSSGTRQGWRGDSRWIPPVALLLCGGVAVGQDAALKQAVVKCVEEDPTGACECAGTSCSSDARFQGKIGTWDVSGVDRMNSLFNGGNACTIYCDFNGDLAAWDTSSVTTMHYMFVRRLRRHLGQAISCANHWSWAGFASPQASIRTSRHGTSRVSETWPFCACSACAEADTRGLLLPALRYVVAADQGLAGLTTLSTSTRTSRHGTPRAGRAWPLCACSACSSPHAAGLLLLEPSGGC